MGEKNSSFCYLCIQHAKKQHSDVGLDENPYNTQGQAAVTDTSKEFVRFLTIYSFFTVGSVKFLQVCFL